MRNGEIVVSNLPATTNIQALLEEFAGYVDAKPQTVKTYLNAVRQFWSFIRERGLNLAGRDAALAWREELRKKHKPNTIQIYLAALRRFTSWAASSGRMLAASAEGVKSVKSLKVGREFKKDFLSADQARELLASIDADELRGKRDYALISLMLTSGIRTIEVARTQVGDIQSRNGCMALAIWGKGRDGKDAYVKLAAPVEKAIRHYLKARGEVDPEEPLFKSTSNRNSRGQMTTRAISGIVKERLRAIGLDSERLTAHSLRHTAATLNLQNGATLEETRDLLRHCNIQTTLLYSHALTWQGNQSEARVAQAIFGG